MNQPILHGVKVLDLGTMITAPLAAMMLAELGADVIKVEHPDRGDPFRRVGADLYSPSFVAYNLGKKSIQLDLRSEYGGEPSASFSARPTFSSRTIARA